MGEGGGGDGERMGEGGEFVVCAHVRRGAALPMALRTPSPSLLAPRSQEHPCPSPNLCCKCLVVELLALLRALPLSLSSTGHGEKQENSLVLVASALGTNKSLFLAWNNASFSRPDSSTPLKQRGSVNPQIFTRPLHPPLLFFCLLFLPSP